jgi:hypothetical protein
VIGPTLAAELGPDAAGLGLLTSAYLFAFALFQLPLGVFLLALLWYLRGRRSLMVAVRRQTAGDRNPT